MSSMKNMILIPPTGSKKVSRNSNFPIVFILPDGAKTRERRVSGPRRLSSSVKGVSVLRDFKDLIKLFDCLYNVSNG